MGAGISLARLASAVADEGGIGVISIIGLGMQDPDFAANPLDSHLRAMRAEIRRARALTDGILGVNIMVALTSMERYVAVAVEEKIDIIFSGAGLPLRLPECMHEETATKLAPIVSSARAVELLCRRWRKAYNVLPDAIVVEGPLAGGHLGFKREEIDDPAFELGALVTQTLEALKPFEEAKGDAIPVIAAGGIYSGEDIRHFLELGAAGVQMGTRFVATAECDATDSFKQAYLDCGPDDLMLIESPMGMPGRAIRNAFLEAVQRGERAPVRCPLHCIHTCPGANAPYCIAEALIQAKHGDLFKGFAFAGTNAWRIDRITTVRELVECLLAEYHRASSSANSTQKREDLDCSARNSSTL